MDAKGSFVELTTLLSLWLALVHHFPREERPGSLEEDGEENTFLESELCPPPQHIGIRKLMSLHFCFFFCDAVEMSVLRETVLFKSGCTSNTAVPLLLAFQ